MSIAGWIIICNVIILGLIVCNAFTLEELCGETEEETW